MNLGQPFPSLPLSVSLLGFPVNLILSHPISHAALSLLAGSREHARPIQPMSRAWAFLAVPQSQRSSYSVHGRKGGAFAANTDILVTLALAEPSVQIWICHA